MGLSRYILDRLLAESPLPIEIVYRDGTSKQYGNEKSRHRITFRSAAATVIAARSYYLFQSLHGCRRLVL